MAFGLNSSISYDISTIDPYVDVSRDEGEQRLALLRPLLRLFARSVDNTQLVDANSDASFGALLSSRRTAEFGKDILRHLLEKTDSNLISICLVKPTVSVITTNEADALTEENRKRCVAVYGASTLAIPTECCSAAVHPSVVVTIPREAAGGCRDAKLNIERVHGTCVKIGIVSSSGARRYLTSGEMPEVVMQKFFAVIDEKTTSFQAVGPKRSRQVPYASKLAIVDFLERRVRLQVLCTAATHAPTSRPVVLDSVYFREQRNACTRAKMECTQTTQWGAKTA